MNDTLTTSLEQALRAAQDELDGMEERQQALLTTRDSLRASLAALGVSVAATTSTALVPVQKAAKAPSARRRFIQANNPGEDVVVPALIDVLSGKPPMSQDAILRGLARKGIVIRGADPWENLYYRISKHRDIFIKTMVPGTRYAYYRLSDSVAKAGSEQVNGAPAPDIKEDVLEAPSR